ncbi:Cu(+)/Ag(+) efflux RND transporter periplasmic adaptor subunit SilB (plasmid) [Klebsiella sp. RHBSTW-00484]|uniref:Copper/silver efflux system membrane fusion protein CusB n=6 Tax=Enterobacteriaceae TaxID=543 RepID=A0A7Z9CNS4_RAOTE|nr:MULTISPECIES: Cu(+)/Ag(+) efflux RND transporter periplasmic adaptor subunit SilB [Gammaproteobacteria]MBA7848677.1 Cu(+)/Ag(+) efflux RND transporter periplasmic adaptor subunit SilB [Klebsiella sp. RHBSTW-00465]MCE9901490.1 Cu(+)/Ag(+) efflux RND transporter periplasmic adaptor subunit SilB [Raoultella terrigena]PLE59001.1 efflux transporter periplasmic adaptor subunit [Klebsiella variicola]QLO40285.1 Cu(+)/Ag(+) efflux RND transporter periplasmic adaptor subunit SilB [Klebsiella sp. RHBST
MASLKIKYAAIIISSLIAGGLISVTAWQYVNSAQKTEKTEQKAPERKVLFWYDPMKPDTKFDKPGKSPFMDMDLLPKYADDSGDKSSGGIRIDPTQVQNLGLKTQKVTRGMLNYSQTIPANVSYNEYQFVIVQARSDGFVEKVYPMTIGDHVKKGTPLIDITIPDWVEAQSEFLLLSSTGGTSTQIKGVLERLRLAGMPEEDIQRLRSTRSIQTRFTIKAPIDGVITAFDLRTGMNISKDKVVAQIQGMDPVWISAAVPESIAYLLKDTSQFEISVPAYPDKTFHVEKWNILPSVDQTTRTLQVRLQVSNKDEFLKPGMNAYLKLNTKSQEMLLIPSQAVIDTGKEQRVITVDDEGKFVPKQIHVLHESQQQSGIGSGLNEGDTVVVSGLFLIDSEANITGALERMRHPEKTESSMPAMSDQPVNMHSGH